MKLKASKDSPVMNPAFYVKNWNADDASVRVNGKAYSDYKVGINRTLEGTDLVVFVNLSKTVPVDVALEGK